MRVRKQAITGLILVLWVAAILAYEWQTPAPSKPVYATAQYPVQRVSDGDTFVILKGQRKEKIRIFGIDCPELNQPFGQQAHLRTKDLIGNQTVTIQQIDRDKYGRTVAQVFTADGKDLAIILTSEGLARWLGKFAPNNRDLQQAERAAKSAERGIWSRR